MTDPTAAVEAVRARHEEVEKHGAVCSCSIHQGGTRQGYGPTFGEQAHADRATLLRAYEAVVRECQNLTTLLAATNHEMERTDTLRAQHAALVKGLIEIRDGLTVNGGTGWDDGILNAEINALLATLGGAEGV